MKHVLTSAAIVALTATSALAEAHTMNADDLIRSRDITGGNVYRMEAMEDDTMWDDNNTMWNDENMYAEVGSDWDTIGEIEDIVLDRNGQMIGIVAEVGGFLDIGDKHIMIPVENVRLTAVDDQTYGYVTRLTDEEIDSMENVDEGFWN